MASAYCSDDGAVVGLHAQPAARAVGVAPSRPDPCRPKLAHLDLHGPKPALRAADVLDAFLAALPAGRDVVLVPHSNAGAYVPELVAQRPVVAAVFVDAILPPSSGRMPLRDPDQVADVTLALLGQAVPGAR